MAGAGVSHSAARAVGCGCVRAAAAVAALAIALWSGASHAQLAACARIEDAAERLACYDALARSETESRSAAPAPKAPAAPIIQSKPVEPAPALASKASVMEQRWELRPDLKRGIFNLVPHKPVYGLVNWTSSPNDQPSSPTRAFNAAQQIDLDPAEGKIQLSFKTKVAERLFDTPADLWFGYTQLSYWQVGNQKHSSPFRETNYEPEAMLIHPLELGIGGLRMRFVGLTLNHQSNGRSGSLSRSWNRLIGEAAAEYGQWSFHVRPWARVLTSGGDRNDNPDIQNYAGRGELLVTRRFGGHAVTLAGRHSLRTADRSRGSAQLDWAFPLAGSINGHVQVFSGYGLNLIDYNHKQTTVGLGVSFFD